MTVLSRSPRPVEAPALTRLVFGEHAFDLATGELRWRGEPVDLEPQPAKVLRHLALHSGEVVPREDLYRLLWGEDTHVEADQGLNYCIKELRRVLGDAARDPSFIETLTRRGYRFLPSVELAGPAVEKTAPPDRSASTPPALVMAPSPPPEPAARRGVVPGRATTRIVVAVLAAAAMLGVGWLSGWLAARSRSQPPATKAAEPAAAPGPHRIAVLPFDAADEVDEDQDVARQLASQLVSDLVGATGPGFDVIASTTSFAYQDAGKTIGQIGRELGVAYVIEGDFQRGAGPDPDAGDGGVSAVRLRVRVVDTREEVVIWTSSYTATAGQLDALPEVVSQEIAATLLPPLS